MRRAMAGVVLLCGCSSKPPAKAPEPALGIAYAGPATLTLRKDLAPRAPGTATVKHGEKIEILETRRRYVRVRTGQGIEGWTDSNLLVTRELMDQLAGFAERAAKLPSQGRATANELLNVHAAPNRQSASFYQLSEGGAVDVLAHRLAPRGAPPAQPAPARKPAPRKTKEKKTQGIPPPPAPAPPPPPQNWVELSRPKKEDLPPEPEPAGKPPAPTDDWYLVRMRDGQVGWVLARALNMAIPDEVAQYAERHRITSYISLGKVDDKSAGVTKDNWLWTTIASGSFPYEFDSFRVFVWSQHRHRYETAYIERNVTGYYPVEAVTGMDTPAFAVVLRDKDGSLVRKTFAFSGYRVRLLKKEPYTRPRDIESQVTIPAKPAAPPAKPGWRERLRNLWR